MISHSPEETRAAGRHVAALVQKGDRILLTGPLGSGKTTFVQGLAEGLGVHGAATSPSFVLVHEYVIGNRQSILRHIDLYRLPDPAVDMEHVGLHELLDDREAITVIEWAERIPAAVVAEVGKHAPDTVGQEGAQSGRSIRVRFTQSDDPDTRDILIENL